MFRLLRWLVQLGWPMRVLNPLFGAYNPFHPDRVTDPYPGYRALRSREPVFQSRLLGIWFLTRHADVTAVLKDPRFSVGRLETEMVRKMKLFRSLSPEFLVMIEKNLLMLDPPQHTRIRGLVNKAFTPRVVERLRPRIQGLVDDLLDGVSSAGEMDLVRDFAYPLPVTVIAEMLGVEPEDRDRFRRWSADLGALLDPFNAPAGFAAANASFAELAAYFREVIAERRRQPRDDLISGLVAAEEGGAGLAEDELISVCALILGAGYETTSNLIGNAVIALLRNPGERKRLQDDPSLIGSAVEEFLRYDSPVQATDRVASEDCEIGGRRIRKGQLVVTLLGAANRDPEQFADPDRLDVARADNRHVAFSQGVHFCLGAGLGRAEAEIAIATLLRRFPNFDGPPDPPAWRPSITLRGPLSLPLTLG